MRLFDIKYLTFVLFLLFAGCASSDGAKVKNETASSCKEVIMDPEQPARGTR